MPVNYARYPPDWKERRTRILHRDGHRCTRCGLPNYAVVNRKEEKIIAFAADHAAAKRIKKYLGGIVIVLTIAHLDWDETNWQVKDCRLQAMCQSCHFAHDKHNNQLRKQYGKYYQDKQTSLFKNQTLQV